MTYPIVARASQITLGGGGDISERDGKNLVSSSHLCVAADGGARHLVKAGKCPDHIIGDLDSLGKRDVQACPKTALHSISEQDSTDFEKCLYSTEADLYRAFGFLGRRIDHQMAVLSALCRYPSKRVLVIGDHDVMTLLPPKISLDIDAGTRVSLFPMGPCHVRSQGLEWPTDGIDFDPVARIGTSNRATGPVTLSAKQPNMIILLPRDQEKVLETSLLQSNSWASDV